jgi:hypothetical protein
VNYLFIITWYCNFADREKIKIIAAPDKATAIEIFLNVSGEGYLHSDAQIHEEAAIDCASGLIFSL